MHTPRLHDAYDTTKHYTDLTAQQCRDTGRVSIDDTRGLVATSSHGGCASNGKTSKNYQNGSRLDSTQVLTPLLSKITAHCSNNIDGIEISHENGSDSSPILLSPSSNNNEWKGSEELNNIKNAYLHNSHQLGSNNNDGGHLNGKQCLAESSKCKKADANQRNCKKNFVGTSDFDSSEFDSVQNGSNLKEPTCGLFGCGPKWARRFASTHIFMVVFLIAYILQGMYMTYFVSVITTIEKLFQIKSKTTGFLLSASEIGQISTAMLLTYFAGRGHRPRWIACGMVLFSIAAFACALPHFIFGRQLLLSNSELSSMVQNVEPSDNLLLPKFDLDNDVSSSSNNAGAQHFKNLQLRAQDQNLCLPGNNISSSVQDCDEDRKMEQASHSKITFIVLCIFFVSLLSSGIGQTAVTTLGIPYIDDNVASKQSPIYMAITIGVRILGPASGFIVGSFCTRWYVNLSNPGFDANDQRWIGAWWLGPVMIGTLMLISSIAMFSFPSELRSKPTDTNKTTSDAATMAIATATAEKEEKPKLKDFPKTVRRQLSNDILMFRTASCVLHLLPIAGLYTFLPKYLETQFRMATYDANMIAAFGGILVMGIGIVVSGLIILKLKPTAKSVAAWIALTALFYSAGMLILTFVGCSMTDFAGYSAGTSDSLTVIQPACNATLSCSCDKENFAPVCGIDGKIYTTACHAGCRASMQRKDDNRTVFTDCLCIPNHNSNTSEPYEAVSGFCNSSCKNFIYFVLIFAFCVFMHSTSEVGSMLLIMRCTHPKDKAMAMGFIQSAIGLFGNVPCPIIYGALVDSACLIWKTVCGKHGACSLYDADTFRRYFLGITAGIMFLAFIMDLVVWSKSHRIDIAPEDHIDKKFDKEAEEPKQPQSNVETTVSSDVRV